MARTGWPSWFSNGPRKHKIGRGRWALVSCQVSLNSGKQFQRRSRNAPVNKSPDSDLSIPIDPKKTTQLGRGRWDMASCQNFFFKLCSVVSVKWLGQSETGCTYWFFDRYEKHKPGRGGWDFFPVKFRWILFSGFREVENVPAIQRLGWLSWFSDLPEKSH